MKYQGAVWYAHLGSHPLYCPGVFDRRNWAEQEAAYALKENARLHERLPWVPLALRADVITHEGI